MKTVGLTAALILAATLIFTVSPFSHAYYYFLFLFALCVFGIAYEIGEQL